MRELIERILATGECPRVQDLTGQVATIFSANATSVGVTIGCVDTRFPLAELDARLCDGRLAPVGDWTAFESGDF